MIDDRNLTDIFRGRDIFIYGYGNLGRNAYQKIKMVFPENRVRVVVTSLKKREKEALKRGIPIISRKEMMEVRCKDNTCVVLALNPLHHEKIIENLRDMGFYHRIYDEKMDAVINRKILNSGGVRRILEIKFLNICVGQACNLKCRDCANFAPYAKQKNLRYDIEEILADVDKIMPFMKRVDVLHIQGGEPFLYTDLDKLLIYLNERYKSYIGNIHIATNGMIMPPQIVRETVKNCENVSVRISGYGNCKIKGWLEKENIPHYTYRFVHGKKMWNYAGGINYVEQKSENFMTKFLRCKWNRCYTIENHLLGSCARSIPAISLQNVNVNKEDYLDLKEDITLDEVSKHFLFFHPMNCCHNCAGTDGDLILPAVQINTEEGF